jgi:curved DNA-binding protein CbpA
VSLDYYRILGVSKTATIDEVKAAYSRKAAQYHPELVSDVSKSDATKRFLELAEAYTVLSNLDKRARYDHDHARHRDVLKADQSEDRDIDGTPLSYKKITDKTEFAEDFRLRLQTTRKEWNVDEFGNSKGGLPRRHRGKLRGTALSYPGEYLDPTEVRNEEAPETAEQYVDERVVEEFKNFKQDDWRYYLSNWTWWRAEVSYEFMPANEHGGFFRYIKYLLVASMLTYLAVQFSGCLKTTEFSVFQRYLKNGKVAPGPDGSLLVSTPAGKLVVDKNGVVRRAEGL